MKFVTLYFYLILGMLITACSETEPPVVSTGSSNHEVSPEQTDPVTVVEVSFNDAQVIKRPTAKTGSWPHWLGPDYNGISRETDWRADWSEKPPQVLWRENVGIGYSSISAADGRIYTMGHKAGNETVFCRDAKTGKEIWKHTYPAKLVDRLNAGGPGATPTIDGEFLYTNGRDGRLICFEIKTGKVVWEKKLTDAYQMDVPEWGFTCSPLILGEKLLIEAGRLVALNKKTGDEIWKSTPHMPGYGTPTAFEIDGNKYLALLNNECLTIVQADDGKEVTTYDWPSPFATNSTTPIIDGKSIFISSGYGKGCALLDFDNRELKTRYTNRDMKNHFNNSVLYQKHFYGMNGNSNLGRVVRLTCIDQQTGKLKWREAGFGCGSLLIADGKLIILSDEGTLVTAKASPDSYQEISRFKVLDHQCWTVPVLCNGLVYCRDSAGNLACVDLRP